MNWLDDDYTLGASLDDDLFKLDSSYHQSGCLPSLDDLSLPSFYTSSINANFKLDSKDKGEALQYEFRSGGFKRRELSCELRDL